MDEKANRLVELVHRSSGRLLTGAQAEQNGRPARRFLRKEAWLHVRLSIKLCWAVFTGKAWSKP